MKLILSVAMAAMCSQAFAYDFSGADALFVKRGEGSAAVQMARDAYRAATSEVTGLEKVKAYEMLARLDYYEGLIKPAQADQKTIFQNCLNDLENIKSEQRDGKPVVEYFYWKSTCLGSWAKANGVIASLVKLPDLLDTLSKGRAVSGNYEGGGFDRVSGPLFQKIPAVAGGSLDKAITFLDSAIAATPYTGEETDAGSYFFNVYLFKAEVLEAQGKSAEALNVVKSALERLDAGDVSLNRVPEDTEYKKSLMALKAKLGG